MGHTKTVCQLLSKEGGNQQEGSRTGTIGTIHQLLNFAGPEFGTRKPRDFPLTALFFLNAEEVDSGSEHSSGTVLALPGPCTAKAGLI